MSHLHLVHYMIVLLPSMNLKTRLTFLFTDPIICHRADCIIPLSLGDHAATVFTLLSNIVGFPSVPEPEKETETLESAITLKFKKAGRMPVMLR